MEQPINSVKITEVAEPLLRMDLQIFAEDLGNEGGEEGSETEIEEETLESDDLDTGENGEGENNQGDADLDHEPPQDDKTNAAFAQMRREKEAAEQQIKAMDALISQQYGDEYGIHTLADFQKAVEAQREVEEQQRREEEMQQYREAGLPDELIEKLEKLDRVDEVLQQAEYEKFNRAVSDGFQEIQKEYPELVKTEEDISDEVLNKWNGGQTGLSLMDAYELVNKQTIREHLQAASKQSALNKVNSKSHLRGNGGEGAEDVDLSSVPAETMATYRQMFAKELRTGKMKESDFVKHYKNSNS